MLSFAGVATPSPNPFPKDPTTPLRAQNAGGCKLEDFSTELLTRNIESERQCSASAPGLDNPLCIGIPSTRDDSRVLSHADAAAIAYEVPYDRHPAPGSRGLPLPCATQLEH